MLVVENPVDRYRHRQLNASSDVVEMISIVIKRKSASTTDTSVTTSTAVERMKTRTTNCVEKNVSLNTHLNRRMVEVKYNTWIASQQSAGPNMLSKCSG